MTWRTVTNALPNKLLQPPAVLGATVNRLPVARGALPRAPFSWPWSCPVDAAAAEQRYVRRAGESVSVSASQASEFYEQVVREGHVYTFLSDDAFLVFPMPDGDTIPFWSSLSRLKNVQRAHPRFRTYALDDITLDAFLEKVIPQLTDEGPRVGVNWSGERLTGYDITPAELRQNLAYWQSKK